MVWHNEVMEKIGGGGAVNWLNGQGPFEAITAPGLTLKVGRAYRLGWAGYELGYPRISQDIVIQAEYVAMRLDGEGHRMAEMLALQTPPMSNTDREFLEGHCNGSQFEKMPYIGDYYAKVARQHGADITGKVYLSGLARFPGDPLAWVAGKGDAERVLDKNGWGSEGAISRKVSNVADTMGCAVAEDLVQDEILDRLEAAGPDAGDINVPDLREKIIETRAPHWAAS